MRVCDEEALVEFYAHLSEDSRHARFLDCARGLDPRLAHAMCCSFNVNEAGFVAERSEGTGREIVGHVCLTDAGRGSLEIGIAIADGVQNQRLGHRLFATALAWAERSGYEHIVASAFNDNWRVLRLLRESGHATLVRDAGSGVSTITIDLNDHLDARSAA